MNFEVERCGWFAEVWLLQLNLQIEKINFNKFQEFRLHKGTECNTELTLITVTFTAKNDGG